MQPRCADDCGLEQGSIIAGLAGAMGLTSSPLLPEGSSMGAKLISSILISHNQQGRSDIRAKPWLAPSALILSVAGSRQRAKELKELVGTYVIPYVLPRKTALMTSVTCTMCTALTPWASRWQTQRGCKQTVASTKLLLFHKGHGAHTTQGAQWERTVKKMGENTLKLSIQV